jgi:hypothetical protein
VRIGDSWSVTFGGATVVVRDAKGIGDLAELLGRPDREVHCLELIGGVQPGGDSGPTIDAAARRAYERRIRDLQADLDEATANHDAGRAERAEAELDALVHELSRALGLGGRTRSTGQVAERARSAVRWRIRATIRRLADVHPELGRHLRNSITTGTWCAYRPELPIEWRIESPRR